MTKATKPERIDFYVLNQHVPDGTLRFACRLTEKAYKLGHKIFVHARDAEQTRKMDDLLWTYSQSSFVPHARADMQNTNADDYPVIIGDSTPPDGFNGLLVSLRDEISPHYAQFERVAEVTDADDDGKAKGRARYRAYQEQGYEPETHQVKV